MENQKIEYLFGAWRAGNKEAWTQLKPYLLKSLRRARPALELPPEHLAAIGNLLCIRLEMAEEDEFRALPGNQYWEFYAALTRLFIVELLQKGTCETADLDACDTIPGNC